MRASSTCDNCAASRSSRRRVTFAAGASWRWPRRPRLQVAPYRGIRISTAEVAHLPKSGTAWTNVKQVADSSLGTANVANQDSMHGTRVFTVALVYARTGNPLHRDKARAAIMSAIGTGVRKLEHAPTSSHSGTPGHLRPWRR